MHVSDLQLLELQADALFTHDATGRIRWINEPGERPAPRFFFGRTKEGNLWRFRHDVPLEVVRRLETLAAAEPVTDDLCAEPVHLAAYQTALQEHAEIAGQSWGPAYYFPDEIQVPSNGVMITEANVELLRTLIPELEMQNISRELSVRRPWVVIVEHGSGVACCFCARKTEQVAEAGVWTLEAFLRRGYALASATAWAQYLRTTGRIPLYSTSWENIASQAVARKLGLIQYAVDLSLM
ncbi:MAG: GNAT family N-acetyltransferase [Herpetosiphonaceae bacterium]|nr:GNAT family N-acetyltransferase [Herpetosiphonaceae bacterium]